MGYVRVVFGGHIYDAYSGGNRVEEWSCGFAVDVATGVTANDVLTVCGGAVQQWFIRTGTNISPSVRLEWIKSNEFNEATGVQITDPTLKYEYPTDYRGAGSSEVSVPTGTAYRISLDNGTRNRRARGGFFVPRVTIPITAAGRFSSTGVAAALTSAMTLFDAVNALSGAELGVYSKADGSVWNVDRVRIGDTPDNISRRRNALVENYQTAALSP